MAAAELSKLVSTWAKTSVMPRALPSLRPLASAQGPNWASDLETLARLKLKDEEFWRSAASAALERIRTLSGTEVRTVLIAFAHSQSPALRAMKRKQKLFLQLMDRMEVPTDREELWKLMLAIDEERLLIDAAKIRATLHVVAAEVYRGGFDDRLADLVSMLLHQNDDVNLQETIPAVLHGLKTRIALHPNAVDPAALCKLWALVRLRDAPFMEWCATRDNSQHKCAAMAECLVSLDIPVPYVPSYPWADALWVSAVRSPARPRDCHAVLLRRPEKNVSSRVMTAARIIALWFPLRLFSLPALRTLSDIAHMPTRTDFRAETSGVHSDVNKVLSVVLEDTIPRQEVLVLGTRYVIDILIPAA
eukprot:GEMP01019838.1.p1 GENE.GEMP01019838.1~~GEMP01019838.1.p1  ORF type:complete len:362 (-),score=81.05 GEMP01019838.1:905-1990(-)